MGDWSFGFFRISGNTFLYCFCRSEYSSYLTEKFYFIQFHARIIKIQVICTVDIVSSDLHIFNLSWNVCLCQNRKKVRMDLFGDSMISLNELSCGFIKMVILF